MKAKTGLLFIIFICILACSCYPASAAENLPSPLILMYHRISDTLPSDAFTITSNMFEGDIKRLTELGYTFCTADELQAVVHEKSPKKLVAITFDDGYTSDCTHALPILEKYNACATFFVIGAKIGTPGYLSEAELQKLAASDAAQIGNHSHSLHEMPYEAVNRLCFTNPYQVLNDIKRNRETLKQMTGKEITAYSYPYGIYGKYLDSLLKQEGFSTFSSDEKLTHSTTGPYGRFNRAFDLPIDEIIRRIAAQQAK